MSPARSPYSSFQKGRGRLNKIVRQCGRVSVFIPWCAARPKLHQRTLRDSANHSLSRRVSDPSSVGQCTVRGLSPAMDMWRVHSNRSPGSAQILLPTQSLPVWQSESPRISWLTLPSVSCGVRNASRAVSKTRYGTDQSFGTGSLLLSAYSNDLANLSL